ncbi:hypothetical protein PENCOP_c015G08673 [Penicillium coprophilum]|uniref:Azaphilone pigments biosynthesis cluster protein L N-terminal domain-containing protein n=1 Tax=Penicillium coprophilum TaxID=36646 RepID=A0A1V6U8P5_9EURO|nr:hypothetical protein PENCOP_c015G08673 [Penicillium coprophilum]
MATLGAISGAVGITSAVAHSIHELIQIINAIKSAPTEIADLKDELIVTEKVLLVLDDANGTQLELLPSNLKDTLQRTNTLCKNACDKFRVELVSWTKYSDDSDGLHWRDRVRFGVIGRSSVKSLCEQLERCKSNLNSAVAVTTMISTIALYSTTDAMQRDLQAEEIDISQQIVHIEEQSAAVQIDLYDSAEESLLDNQEYTLLRDQLNYQRATLDASQGLMKDLLARARQTRTSQNITGVEISEKGKLLVGRIGSENREGELYQEIHNIKTTTSGKGIVGVVEGLDIKAFFKD